MISNEVVSVIMSTYNESESDLRKAISSVLCQTYKNIEFLIVCDNPGNENLKRLLIEQAKGDSRITLLMNDVNIGLTRSLNKAIGLSSGSIIARMDADDFSMPDRIEKQLAYLAEMDLDLVGTYVECVDEHGNTIYFMKSMPTTKEEISKKICCNNPIAHPTWLGKKHVFVKNGGYRDIPYAEDYDFLLRAFSKGFKFGNLNEVLFKYTLRETSISKSNGLKQYLVSKRLVKEFKNKALDQCTKEQVIRCFDKITEKDEHKFAKASNIFASAAQKLENRNLFFIFDVLKAGITSKYYLGKIAGYIKTFL